VDGAGLQGKIWYNLANLCGIGLGTLFRFWSYRKWVWRTQEPTDGVPAAGHHPVSPAPGFPEAEVAEAVAVGLDEEATLFGRGAENYGRPEGYAPGTGDHRRGREGNGDGTRPAGPRHAAKQR
jgi:hypothetical protein